MKHYLDYNATAPLRAEALTVMHELLVSPLNASSVHSIGRRAKSALEGARRSLADAVGAFPTEIIFTSSGTEANNWVLHAHRSLPIFVSAIEHVSILKPLESGQMPVDKNGVIDVGWVECNLPKSGQFLVSLMLANNETGVIQPVRDVAQIVHRRGGFLHCDAVQAIGKIPVDFTALGCDFMTLSGHKMGGPVGAAALIVKNGVLLTPLLAGGGQELNRRAGTENIAAIAGFAEAIKRVDLQKMQTLRIWLQTMEAELTEVSEGDAVVFSADALRLPNTSCISMPNVKAETQLIRFDLEGIAVSAGAACSSGRLEPSYALAAMGFSQNDTMTALRISGGWATVEEDIRTAASTWKKMFRELNKT